MVKQPKEFIMNLRRMLKDSGSATHWVDNTHFKIADKDLLVDDIARHYGHRYPKLFMKHLIGYGFERYEEDNDPTDVTWAHPLFKQNATMDELANIRYVQVNKPKEDLKEVPKKEVPKKVSKEKPKNEPKESYEELKKVRDHLKAMFEEKEQKVKAFETLMEEVNTYRKKLNDMEEKYNQIFS
jgi:hypothetical protein